MTKTPNRTPDQWADLLAQGDGSGLIPHDAAVVLWDQGRIAHLPARPRRGDAVMVRLTATTADPYGAIAKVLNDHPHEPVPAYVWHTGGGIMAVRVDIAPEGGTPKADDPYLLVTPRAEFDGGEGYAIGYYPTWEHDGGWPIDGKLRFVADLDGIHAVIMDGADALCGGEAGA